MSVKNFIPTIWSARLLEHLDNAHVARNFFNTNWEGEIRDMGDTVRINQIGAVNIIEYTPNQDLPDPEELSMVAQSLVIDQADAFSWQIDDVDAAQMRADLMDAAMERSAYELADKMDKYLFKQLADAAAPSNSIGTAASPVVITENNVYDIFVQMRTLLTKTNTPSVNRQIAVPPEMVGMLLKDDRFTGTGGTFAEGTLLSGLVARGVGFSIFEINNLPVTGSTVEIVANHNVSATYAHQIAKTEAARMEKRFADNVKGLSVYGAKVVEPKAVAKLYATFA